MENYTVGFLSIIFGLAMHTVAAINFDGAASQTQYPLRKVGLNTAHKIGALN